MYGNTMIEKIPIIIVSHNRKDMLEKCMEGIRKNTDPKVYDIVLVDNGSDFETSNFIEKQNGKKDIFYIIKLSRNEGFARGYNLGLNLIKDRKFMVILNNDTVPADGWLANIILLYSLSNKIALNNKVGLILPYTNFCCNHGIIVDNEKIGTNTIEINGNVPAVCWGITKKCYVEVCKIIKKLGGGDNFFHNDFEYGWAEDILTSEIITRLGFLKYASGGSFIYHHGSATQNILKAKEDYRSNNMNKLGKYFKMLDEIDKKELDIF